MPSHLFRFPLRLLLLATMLAWAGGAHAQQDAAPPDAANDPALEPYFVANGAYNRRLYPVAITQYEEFLAKHPNHAKADLARQGLALSQYALKQYEKAMPHLEALLAKDSLDPQISRERLVMLQGQCLMQTGRRDEAGALFEARIGELKTASYRDGALAAICDLRFGKSEWQQVLDWSAKLLAGSPTPEQAARALYQQGYAHYQLGKPEAAIAALGKIKGLEADKHWQTRADYLLGECHNQRKEYPQAETAFAAALPGLTGADAAECRYRLGLTRFVLQNYQQAAADLAASLESGLDGARTAEAKLWLARARLELGDFDKAAPLLTELSKGEGDPAVRACWWLARLHTRRSQDYDQAAKILGETLKRFPESAIRDELEFDYANALMARGEPDWQAALGLLAGLRQRGSFPQMDMVLSQQAICQHKLGDYEPSLATVEAFLAAHPEHASAADGRFMRAENLFLLGRLEPAAQAYGEFAAKYPEHGSRAAADFRLAQIHHEQGRWNDCLKIAQPMLKQPPAGRLFEPLPFLVGDCLFRTEQWAAALEALDFFLAPRVKTAAGAAPAITPEPNVDTALMQRAVAHERLGQRDDALRNLALLVNHYPQPTTQLPLALTEQGRLAFEKNDLKLARAALERFLAEDQKSAEPFKQGAPAQRARVAYYLGWVEATEERHAEAAKRFAAVATIDSNHPLAADAALQQGIAWVNSGDFAAAAKHFPEVLNRYPKHDKLPRLVFYAGLALARLEQWDQAAPFFARVAAEFADSEFADQALYELAWCERRRNKNAEAVKCYEKLLASHADSPLAVKVQSELAELNLESGAQDQVIGRLTKALADVKDDALREDLRYQLATAHFKSGDHATAAKQFESFLADYPKSQMAAPARFQAGESRLKLEETAAARDHFAAAAAADDLPASLGESVTMRLAETQALTGQHEQARDTYAAFLKNYPDSRWTRNARFGLAFAMESAGDSKSAIPEYQKLLADQTVDLWTVRGRFQLGECLFNLRQYDEAVAEFVKVEISYKQYPAWQAKSVLEIARILMAQKKHDLAAERLKDVIRNYPKEKAATVAQQFLDELRAQ